METADLSARRAILSKARFTGGIRPEQAGGCRRRRHSFRNVWAAGGLCGRTVPHKGALRRIVARLYTSGYRGWGLRSVDYRELVPRVSHDDCDLAADAKNADDIRIQVIIRALNVN